MDNLVKVEGEMVCRDGTGRRFEFFEEEFIIDGSVDTIPKARSLIRKALIADRLQKKTDGKNLIYPDFRKVRTLQVISMNATEEKAEHSDLDKAMLKAIELGCVPENLDNYKRSDYRLKALERAIAVAENRKQSKDNVTNLGIVD
jgi:hypothetical protein